MWREIKNFVNYNFGLLTALVVVLLGLLIALAEPVQSGTNAHGLSWKPISGGILVADTPQHYVGVSFACHSHEAIEIVAAAYQTGPDIGTAVAVGEKLVSRDLCVSHDPVLAPILAAEDRLYVDFQGDQFFIVELVSGDPGVRWFTLAYPGLNSDIPKRISYRI